MADYDLAIIGGGLSGTAIARDAAGRGLRVVLIEQNDLGGNSASTGLVHGDLARLERGHLFGTRRALAERAIWLRIAPHLVTPLRIAMPAHPQFRTPMGIRTLLVLHDRLSPRDGLPRSTTLDVTHHEVGVPLQRPFNAAFGWTECIADTTRIVALSAVDAAERGAAILTGARCVRADRAEVWKLAVVNRGTRMSLAARALVNATGAWIASVAETVLRRPPPRVRLMLSSRIVVRRRFDHDGIYALQGAGGIITHVVSSGDDFTTIGTVTQDFVGDPAITAPSASDVKRLCLSVNRYFRERIDMADVVHVEARAHALSARGRHHAGSVQLQAKRGVAPLLTVFGGDLTMSRRRAERAVDLLTPFYPMSPAWTATQPLPGGDFGSASTEDQIDDARHRWRFLDPALARRMVAAYGTRLDRVLGQATHRDDLGPWFGGQLSAAEVRYLMAHEWARFPEDVLWRRSRLGLSMDRAGQEALAAFMAASVEPARSGG